MARRRLFLVLAILAPLLALLTSLVLTRALTPTTAHAFDPQHIDIIAYRLGMTEVEVLDVLEYQGFIGSVLRRQVNPCGGDAATGCQPVIEARTRDGTLTFRFSTAITPAVVERITYAFDGRKPGIAEALERSVLARYGPPNGVAPMTWCKRPVRPGVCPADAPRLVFEAGPGQSRMLTLTAR